MKHAKLVREVALDVAAILESSEFPVPKQLSTLIEREPKFWSMRAARQALTLAYLTLIKTTIVSLRIKGVALYADVCAAVAEDAWSSKKLSAHCKVLAQNGSDDDEVVAAFAEVFYDTVLELAPFQTSRASAISLTLALELLSEHSATRVSEPVLQNIGSIVQALDRAFVQGWDKAHLENTIFQSFDAADRSTDEQLVHRVIHQIATIPLTFPRLEVHNSTITGLLDIIDISTYRPTPPRSSQIRLRAAQGIIEICAHPSLLEARSKYIEFLLDGLSNGTEDCRLLMIALANFAAVHLRRNDFQAVVGAHVLRLRKDPIPAVRLALAVALTKLAHFFPNEPSFLKAILALRKDREQNVREAMDKFFEKAEFEIPIASEWTKMVKRRNGDSISQSFFRSLNHSNDIIKTGTASCEDYLIYLVERTNVALARQTSADANSDFEDSKAQFATEAKAILEISFGSGIKSNNRVHCPDGDKQKMKELAEPEKVEECNAIGLSGSKSTQEICDGGKSYLVFVDGELLEVGKEESEQPKLKGFRKRVMTAVKSLGKSLGPRRMLSSCWRSKETPRSHRGAYSWRGFNLEFIH